MNVLTYASYAMAGLVFCMALTARIIFGDVETISWPLWMFSGIICFVVIKLLWRVTQRKLFGESLVIDVTKFVPPPVCALCLNPAKESRTVFFHSTHAGPIPISQHAELPLMLCSACSQNYDEKFLKAIKGVRIARVVYENWTVQFKNPNYLQAVLDSNRESGAVRHN